MPTKINGQPTSKEILQTLAELNEPIALSFSCGKDSLAAWLALKEYDIEVIPFYFYLVPELEFINEELKYFEDVFQTRIYRYPNPAFFRLVGNCCMQPPERIPTIVAMDLPRKMTYEQEWEIILEDVGLKQDTWKADGVRAADSLNRRASFVRYGVMKHNSHKVSPIADWLKSEVMDIIKKHNIKLPVDYEIFGRSFDGIDYRFIAPLREHLPNDFNKLLEWFPFIVCDFINKGEDAHAFKV